MASIIPSSLPPRVRSRSNSLTRGSRGLKRNASTTSFSRPTDVTHVIRVTVLGLAGITVNSSKCRESVAKPKPTCKPAPPGAMRAVIAFSRRSNIRGTTNLSKPLVLSPSDDIVVASPGKEEGVETPEHRHSRIKRGSDFSRTRRHVAVWASEAMTLGSTVAFEADLHLSDKEEGKTSGASSSYIPKSFELTIALAEDDDESNKIALPCGISSLAISGDECKNGQAITMDLPVLGLTQARPLGLNKNGLGGYPMIAITPKQMGTEEDKPVEDVTKKKKARSGLHRLFKRSGSKVPSIAERQAFATAYTMDPTGDAVLRVSLEVYEKGSEVEQIFVRRRQQKSSKGKTTLSPPASTRKSMSLKPENNDVSLKPIATRRNPSVDVSADEVSSSSIQDSSNSFGTPKIENKTAGRPPTKNEGPLVPSDEFTSDAKDVETELQNDCVNVSTPTRSSSPDAPATPPTKPADEEDTSESVNNDGTVDDTVESGTSEMEEGSSSDSESVVTTEDNNDASFQWTSTTGKTVDSLDDYTLSFTEKKTPPNAGERKPRIYLEEDGQGGIALGIFGRKIQVPTCGAFSSVDEGDDETILTKDANWTSDPTRLSEEGTYVTAKFFGRNYRIPILSRFVGKDEDTATMSYATGSARRVAGISGLMDSLCRMPKSQRDLDIVNTFSSFSETQKSKDNRTDSVASEAGSGTLATNEFEPKASDTPETSNNSNTSPDCSPAHVAEFPHGNSIAEDDFRKKENKREQPSMKPAVGQSLADLFGCRAPDCVDDSAVLYEPYAKEVPPVIIPSTTDESSVGDLTATTHELQVAAKQSKELENVIAGKAIVPLPIAFGGDGLCQLKENDPSPYMLEIKDSEGNSGDDGDGDYRDGDENYFAEYDDHESLRPQIEVQRSVGAPDASKSTRPDSRSSGAVSGKVYSDSVVSYQSMSGSFGSSIPNKDRYATLQG